MTEAKSSDIFYTESDCSSTYCSLDCSFSFPCVTVSLPAGIHLAAGSGCTLNGMSTCFLPWLKNGDLITIVIPKM